MSRSSRSVKDVDMAGLLDQVLQRWTNEKGFSPATLEKCGDLIQRFARRLEAQGVTDPELITAEHCRGFIAARTKGGQPPEITTQHARRSSLRMLFKTLRDLGVEVADPTLDIVLTPRSGTQARPLSDVEVSLCRTTARLGEAGGRSLHRAVCWALGETTAVSSEISAVRVGDVDDTTTPRWIRLPGTRRHDPRMGELTGWGTLIIARQLDLLHQRRCTPATPLAYKGQGIPGEPAAQSAVCNAIGAILNLAGLATEPDVRPASLRNWAGRQLYDAGLPIERVARRMGARTLDATATDIALEWRTP